MLLATLCATLLQAAPSPTDDSRELGVIEFSRDDTLRVFHSIKIFVYEGEHRIRYLDEIGHHGSRTLKVSAPPGTHEFVVIVEQASGSVSTGAPSDLERRRRPNVEVEVLPGHVVPVSVGGFTDFNRNVTGTNAGRYVTDRDDVEASHFRTMITVGEPRKLDDTDE